MKKINKWAKYLIFSLVAFCGLSGVVTYSNELATKQFLIEQLDLAEKQLTSLYGVTQSVLTKNIQYAQLAGLIKERYTLICQLISDIERQLSQQDKSQNHTKLLTKTKQLLEMWEQLLKPLSQILHDHLTKKRPTDFVSDLKKVKTRLERRVSFVKMDKIIQEIEKLTAQDPELSAKFKGLKQQIETKATHTASILNNMGNMTKFKLLSALYNNR